jgi:uncharacterized membrane protein YhhN
MNTVSSIDRSMLRKAWLILFAICLTTDIVATALDHENWRFFSKPLLMPLLAGFFLANTTVPSPLKKYIVAALFFSWTGDVLLMFQDRQSGFFLLGLSAFLIAHIFYIFFYHQVRRKENVKSRWWLLVVVALYYAALISLLYPYLGDMKIPVPVYGIVISFMLLLALHMFFIRHKTAGAWMMTGAILFILSDSILAINKFYRSFETGGLLTMLTYGLAQAFIVTGAILYLSANNNSRIAVS